MVAGDSECSTEQDKDDPDTQQSAVAADAATPDAATAATETTSTAQALTEASRRPGNPAAVAADGWKRSDVLNNRADVGNIGLFFGNYG